MELKNVKPSDNYNDLITQFNALKTIAISKSAEIEVYKRKIEEFSVGRIIKLEAQLESEKQMNSILTEELKNKIKQMYNKKDMIDFAEFVASYPDKNRNHKSEMLHAKSKYDGAERTIDLLEIWLKESKTK